MQLGIVVIVSFSVCPSSMYFDEDGDLAHEFYQEARVVSKSGVVRWSMKRIFNNLTPQVHTQFIAILVCGIALS